MNAYDNFTDLSLKYQQIVFLYHKKHESCSDIAELTGYAKSTVRTYASKYISLLDEACNLFKGTRKKTTNYSASLEFHISNELPKDADKFYLIRAYDDNNKCVFSKVGTTHRDLRLRMREHLKAYAKLGVTRIVIDKIWDCGNIPSEGVESWFRSYYIRKYPNAFHKNDRFFDIEFDINEAETIFTNYINLCL